MENKKRSYIFLPTIVTIFLTLVAVGVRTYDLINNTVQSSGFYVNAKSWSVITVSVIAVLVCLVALSTGVLKRNTKNIQNTDKNIPLACVSLAFAVTLIVDFVAQVVNIYTVYSAYNYRLPLKTYLYQAGIVPMSFQGIFALAAAIFFGLYAFKRFGSSINLKYFKLLALAPSIWLMCRMIVHFMSAINYLNVSERLFEMFAVAFGMVFFFEFARSLNKVCDKNNSCQYIIFGLPLAFFALLISLPRLFVVLTGNSSLLVASEATSITDLMMGAFAFAKFFDKR